MRRQSDPGSAALLACGGVAALLYSNFLLDWTRRGFVGMDDVVSRLEAPGEPHAMLLRTTDVVCAILVVALLPWVRAALPRGPWREVTVWSTVVFALGATVAAFVPPPCGPDVVCAVTQAQVLHDTSSIASDAVLYVGVAAAWLATRRSGPSWFHRAAAWVFWVGGVVSSALFALVNATGDPAWAPGLSQRAHIVCISAWVLCLTFLAARSRISTDLDTSEEHRHVHTH